MACENPECKCDPCECDPCECKGDKTQITIPKAWNIYTILSAVMFGAIIGLLICKFLGGSLG